MESLCEMRSCEKCTTDPELKIKLCPICVAQHAMKGKWKIIILWLLREEPRRFSELKKLIPNITQTYLSSQLKSLEADKLVVRESFNEVPPKVEYSLTNTGKRFGDVLESMSKWGNEYLIEHVFPQMKE